METSGQSHSDEDGRPFIELFPSRLAGVPISDMGQSVPGFPQDALGTENCWYLFQTQHDWDFAQGAKNRGPSSTAVTELLTIEGVSS